MDPKPLTRFLDLEDLDDATLAHLLKVARGLEAKPLRTTLKQKVLALIFANPSLRTLASFQAGMIQLGGQCVVLTPGQGTWGFEIRRGIRMEGTAAEHVREAIPVLEQYADGIGLRCFSEGRDLGEDLTDPFLAAVAEVARKPFISLESGTNHPCQALGDWKTLDDLGVPGRGGRFVLSWAYHPKALPLAVPNAVACMAARRGMDLTVLRPEGFGLPPEIMDRVRRAAKKGGGTVRETSDRAAAMDGAHVLYAKSWQAPSAYGRPEEETALRARFKDWCVDEAWYRPARKDAIFMHCLPVRRNVKVREEVLEGPRSRVIRQAGNRLHVQKAVMLELLGGDVKKKRVR